MVHCAVDIRAIPRTKTKWGIVLGMQDDFAGMNEENFFALVGEKRATLTRFIGCGLELVQTLRVNFGDYRLHFFGHDIRTEETTIMGSNRMQRAVSKPCDRSSRLRHLV